MTTSGTLSQALARLSNDRRRTVAQYVNIQARPGSANTPRRLISDVGFLQERQFAYVATHPANFSIDDTANQRAIRQIIVVPYGIAADYARITSTSASDRLIHTVTNIPSGGMASLPNNDQLLMSGALDGLTYSAPKTAAVIRAMTTTTGPAPHFVINRLGDISVGPPVDAETTYISEFADTAVFIAVEAALAISRDDHNRRRFDRIIEMPFTGDQTVTLATLVKKLLVAFGTSLTRQFSTSLSATSTGFAYLTRSQTPAVTLRNFSEPEYGGFDYGDSSAGGFFDTVEAQGSYDLSTEVWRPLAAPQPVAGREEVRNAMSNPDTAGAESVYLGAYAAVAAFERSNEMQAVPRAQIFAQRQRVAVRDADDAGSHSATVAETGGSATLPTEIPASYEPHTYDFNTGKWGDNSPY